MYINVSIIELTFIHVGIGVPILLAYVYGVVPISLCRGGGCGVTATESGGVHLDFDDEADVANAAAAGGGPYTGRLSSIYCGPELPGCVVRVMSCYLVTADKV